MIAHFNAITSYAAPLNKTDANKVIQAISNTEQGNSGRFYSNLMNSSTVYIRSFTIRNLEAPVHGKLLDDTATVVADNGVSWDIPVIWINKDGDIIHIAVEIDDIIRSYPIFVFYMPEKCSVLFGENASYNIEMPDFVVALMKQNGVTALSIPEADRTYISTFLPGADKLKINYSAPVDEPKERGNDDSKIVTQGDNGDSSPNPPIPQNPVPGQSSESTPNPAPSPAPGSYLTPPTDNALTPPDPGLTAEEKLQVTNAHCDDNVIQKIGVDKLAALITWVKKTLEPEAANLLVSKFPAYKEAANNNELGKNIGLYIYYDQFQDSYGNYDDCKYTLAVVDAMIAPASGDIRYRVGVNARYFYNKDSNTNEWVFDGTTHYSVLDNTLVHEMMHAYMYDYTRTGMAGFEASDSSWCDYERNSELDFPDWFIEGMASTVDNTFQYRYPSIHDSNDMNHYDYGYDITKNKFEAEALKQAYTNDPRIQIAGQYGEGSAYISGYLACIYLGYLAAKTYDGTDAIDGDRIDSSVILSGENHILEKLHNGNSLSSIISEISPKVDGKTIYDSTSSFEQNFIRDLNGSDDVTSAEFCTKLLNYFQQNSTDTSYANGSILLDFADNNNAQLNLSLLNQPQTVYVPTDDRQLANSTVDTDIAYASGGNNSTTNSQANAGKIIVGSTITEEPEHITIVEEGSPGTDDGSNINNENTYYSSDADDDETTHTSADSDDFELITTPVSSIATSLPASDENAPENSSTPTYSWVEAVTMALSDIKPPSSSNISTSQSVANSGEEQVAASDKDTNLDQQPSNNTDVNQQINNDTGSDNLNSDGHDSNDSDSNAPDSDDTSTDDIENVSSKTQTYAEATSTKINDSELTHEETTSNDEEALTDREKALSNQEKSVPSDNKDLLLSTEGNTSISEPKEDGALSSENSDEEVVNVTVVREEPDDTTAPIQNPLIISEAGSEDDENENDDNSSEQVLDVIPEDHSDDESEATDAADPQTD